MQGIDFQFKELHVSEAIGLPLQCFDFIVGSLQGAG
jgi:hypothetical protein